MGILKFLVGYRGRIGGSLALLVLLTTVLASTASATEYFNDDFNRANNVAVGFNWSENEAGAFDLNITENQLGLSRRGTDVNRLKHIINFTNSSVDDAITINFTVILTGLASVVAALTTADTTIDDFCGLQLNFNGLAFFRFSDSGVDQIMEDMGTGVFPFSLVLNYTNSNMSLYNRTDFIDSRICNANVVNVQNTIYLMFGVKDGTTGAQYADNVSVDDGEAEAPPTPAIPELRVTARDNFDFTTLTNYSVTIWNATATLTNSTTTGGDVRFANVNNETSYTINISSNTSGGYFDVNSTPVTIESVTSLTVDMFQAFITFNATQIFTGNTINGVNVSANTSARSQFNTSTTNLVELRLNASTFTLLAAANNHFNATPLIITTTALQNLTVQLVFGDARFNITAFESLQNVTITSGFTFNASPNNLTTFSNLTATAATLFDFVLLQGNTYDYTATFTDTNFVTVSGEFTISAASGNLSIFSFVIHSVNVQFFDEETNLPLIVDENSTVFLGIIGPTTANFTTINGSIFLQNLTPGDYELRYETAATTERSFFFSLPAGGSDNLRLYLLNSSLSTLVIATVVDENDDPLNNSILKIQRLYASDGVFRTVEMSRANFNGEAPINIILNTQFYRFFVDQPLGTNIFSSQTETKLTATTIRIVVTPLSGRLDFVTNLNRLATSLTSTRDGNNITFTYTFADVHGFIADGCLVVEQVRLQGGDITLCNVCDSGSSSTLQCNVNISSGTLHAYGTINTTNPHQLPTNVLDIIITDALETFGLGGVFLAVIIFVSIVGLMTFNISVGVVAAIIALTVTSILGLFVISASTIVALLFAGILIILKQKNQ